MMEDRTLFRMKINIDSLDDIYPESKKSAGDYDCELVIDSEKNNDISLKIFFDPKENLDSKIGKWCFDNRHEKLVNTFQVIKVNHPENLLNIEFHQEYHKRISNSTEYYENGNQYFIVGLKKVEKVYKNDKIQNCQAYLNAQSFKLTEMYYRYNLNFSWSEEEYSWSPKNRLSDFIQFGRVSFKLEHRFFNSSKNENQVVSITKQPRITLKHNGLTVSEVKNHINLLCTLLSFYSHQVIDYSVLRIYTEKKLQILIQDVDNNHIDNVHGLFAHDFHLNPIVLISNVNTDLLLNNLVFFQKIVYRFIYSLRTSGESRFMILYSILEQIRNRYIKENQIEIDDTSQFRKVKEEYSFTLSKKKTKKFIKEKLELILEIVKLEDRELFSSELSPRINQLTKISMSSQFNRFFEHIKIDPQDFELDFQKVRGFRNSIFHGNPISNNIEEFDTINRQLPRLIGTVILRYAGFNSFNPTIPLKNK